MWDPSITYYDFTNPEYVNGKFYTLVVHGWQPVTDEQRLTNSPEVISAWRSCVSNGKYKLLKAPNGNSWVVSVSDQTSLDVNWQSSDYPATISFNWQEVLDKNKISIIKW